MNKITTINLNGRAYQLEETGYESLHKYINEARSALNADPDQDEIIKDLEQAIAEKCDAKLSAQKNVITSEEVAEILKVMGPVESGNSNGSNSSGAKEAGAEGKTPKHLFRIIDGSLIRGVCTGLAAYFNIDVTIVRVLFILLTILTGGVWVAAYIVMIIVLPVARTADEVAEAHGQPPFTAQDFIDRAKSEYHKIADDPRASGHEFRQKMRAWRMEMREKRHQWRHEMREERRMNRQEFREWHHEHGNGFRTVFGGIVTAFLWIIFISVIWTFLTHGTVFGHIAGAGLPIWAVLLFIILVFGLVTMPFRAMMCSSDNCHHRHHHVFGGFIWAIIWLILLFYIASLLFPTIHIWWQHCLTYMQTVR